jgi:hypothetical protein
MVKLSTIVSASCVAYAGATRINFENGRSVAFLAATSSAIRGGSDVYAGSPSLDEIKGKANKKIEELRVKIMDEATIVSDFGAKADAICNQALEAYAQNSGVDASKLAELEAALDAPLQVLYLRQLALLREQALESYRSASSVSETSDYEAMLQADAAFTSAAQAATREGSNWDFAAERSHLQSIMNDIASTRKKLMDVQMKSSEKQSTAMAFLQQQQQMIQQLQMQLYGQSSPWNLGAAYRIPDTNFNIQGSYQQGRANVQLSCVPDEYAGMLGANGFTNGVGPGNLGLSLNISL